MQPKRILVALAGSSADPDVIRLVAWIAKPAKAQVVGIHVIEVRWNLPLDAVMEQELDRGEELLVLAAERGDTRAFYAERPDPLVPELKRNGKDRADLVRPVEARIEAAVRHVLQFAALNHPPADALTSRKALTDIRP